MGSEGVDSILELNWDGRVKEFIRGADGDRRLGTGGGKDRKKRACGMDGDYARPAWETGEVPVRV